MKLSSGKRIGQSGHELATAVVFSFALHALTLAAAVFLYMTVTPKTYVPPFYEVKLVGQSAELPQTPSTAGAAGATGAAGAMPVPPKPQVKPVPKGKKAPARESKAPARTKKGAMPELAASKPKSTQPEQTKPEEMAREQPHPSIGAPGGTATPGAKTENVALATPQDFKFLPYMGIVREKIGVNWNPPPGATDIKVTVQFTILRSGRVGDVKLAVSSGNFYFDQAAVRAIISSSPFPPMPEGFYKEYEVFSVDLMEKE